MGRVDTLRTKYSEIQFDLIDLRLHSRIIFLAPCILGQITAIKWISMLPLGRTMFAGFSAR